MIMETLSEKKVFPAHPKLNLGCGDMILDGWVNCDKHNPKADIKADVLELPFENQVFEEVLLSHVIEHVSYRKHMLVYDEIHRVLKDGGKFTLAFPDFMETAKAFLENRNGDRWTWWVQTLYGMQISEGQYHIAPVTTDHALNQLRDSGFGKFETDMKDCDAVIVCYKTEALPWHNEEESWTGIGL